MHHLGDSYTHPHGRVFHQVPECGEDLLVEMGLLGLGQAGRKRCQPACEHCPHALIGIVRQGMAAPARGLLVW